MTSPPCDRRASDLDLCGPTRRREHAVPDNERETSVLLLQDDSPTMETLRHALTREGIQVDAVAGLDEARATFFGAGGHGCLVVAPGVRPKLAQQVAASLGAIDPALGMATFGPELHDAKLSRSARLGGYHPGSRAGQGALLRFLRTL